MMFAPCPLPAPSPVMSSHRNSRENQQASFLSLLRLNLLRMQCREHVTDGLCRSQGLHYDAYTNGVIVLRVFVPGYSLDLQWLGVYGNVFVPRNRLSAGRKVTLFVRWKYLV